VTRRKARQVYEPYHAGDLADRQKAKKEFRNKPPTEEERAALRAAKEEEKLAKAQAKALTNDISPDELKARQEKAAAVAPKAPEASGSEQKVVR